VHIIITIMRALEVPAQAPDILIRPCRVDDAQPMYEAVRESLTELIEWMPWCHKDYSLSEAKSWLRTQVQAFSERKWFEFAIVDPMGRYLGNCGLNQIDEANRRCNLGYWVRSSATGRGFAARSVAMTRDWAFEHTNLARLEIVIAVGNHRSLRVAEKAGATREGILRQRLLLHGIQMDAVMFSLVRP
jgi:RimJ/RimL family protein N-acetyltransferase